MAPRQEEASEKALEDDQKPEKKSTEKSIKKLMQEGKKEPLKKEISERATKPKPVRSLDEYEHQAMIICGLNYEIFSLLKV